MVMSPEPVITLFAELFSETEQTILVRGDREPVYLPRGGDRASAQVVFAHGFVSSALHEVAHWCVAGSARRALPDYGYWYKPDGRSADEQRAFEQVEVKPQALEWIFSRAAGIAFNFSADNLGDGGAVTTDAWLQFQKNVWAEVQRYLARGLPERAARFAAALAQCYGSGSSWRDPCSYAEPR